MASNPGYCAACGLAGEVLEHHFVPRSQGGAALPSVYLCAVCLCAVLNRSRVDRMILHKIGVAKAKAAGKYKGRKPTARAKYGQVVKLASQGIKRDVIAKQLGISIASVYRALAAKPA